MTCIGFYLVKVIIARLSKCTLFLLGGRNTVYVIATRYWLDNPGIESRFGRDFPRRSRQTLGRSRPPVKWVLDLFSEGKMVGCGVERSFLSNADTKVKV